MSKTEFKEKLLCVSLIIDSLVFIIFIIILGVFIDMFTLFKFKVTKGFFRVSLNFLKRIIKIVL